MGQQLCDHRKSLDATSVLEVISATASLRRYIILDETIDPIIRQHKNRLISNGSISNTYFYDRDRYDSITCSSKGRPG